MMATILKSFPYSPDGVRVARLHAGDEAEIREDLAEMLECAGLIRPVGATPDPAAPRRGRPPKAR